VSHPSQLTAQASVCVSDAQLQWFPIKLTTSSLTSHANAGESANGKFPDTAVRTMAAIVANAENASGYTATQCFIRFIG
jgi:hypothetical protein